ncbi:flavin reductase family protein [Candidatus Poribacteria bacterium]|nr:flavin reductase family protein [Candidatus Poribacteria bacterium]
MKKTILKPSTFLLPCPVGLITTQGKNNKQNIITLAWIGIIASEPPMLSISIRPSRFSHALLKENSDFVINIPTSEQLEKVDYCGTVSGQTIDKFNTTGFTANKASQVKAPIITECPINLECQVKQIITYGSHDVFLAEILAVQVNEDVIGNDNKWSIEKINPLVYCPPTHEYWTLKKSVGSYGLSHGKITKK